MTLNQEINIIPIVLGTSGRRLMAVLKNESAVKKIY